MMHGWMWSIVDSKLMHAWMDVIDYGPKIDACMDGCDQLWTQN
jgi:hypothetical protein